MDDEAPTESPPLAILHEESHFMVVDKPVGLFTQAAPGVASLQNRLTEQLKLRDQHVGIPFVGLPHRLDRGTSGVILIARNQRALSRFGEQFHSRKIGKYYLAAVVGDFPNDSMNQRFEWSDYVRKVVDQPLAEICDATAEGAKLAQLTAQALATAGGVTLLLIKLHTGRMHQIRIQAASRGMRILGDLTYGGPEFFDLQEDEEQEENDNGGSVGELASMALHALRLEIRHPQSAKQMAFTAAPPTSWDNLPRDLCTAITECVARSRRENNVAWEHQ
jgi:23S rRNA pseudouridine1911/1915/1917 synthase